jgi:hypothetical protein
MVAERCITAIRSNAKNNHYGLFNLFRKSNCQLNLAHRPSPNQNQQFNWIGTLEHPNENCIIKKKIFKLSDHNILTHWVMKTFPFLVGSLAYFQLEKKILFHCH